MAHRATWPAQVVFSVIRSVSAANCSSTVDPAPPEMDDAAGIPEVELAKAGDLGWTKLSEWHWLLSQSGIQGRAPQNAATECMPTNVLGYKP